MEPSSEEVEEEEEDELAGDHDELAGDHDDARVHDNDSSSLLALTREHDKLVGERDALRNYLNSVSGLAKKKKNEEENDIIIIIIIIATILSCRRKGKVLFPASRMGSLSFLGAEGREDRSWMMCGRIITKNGGNRSNVLAMSHGPQDVLMAAF